MKMKMKKSFYIALSILFINCSLERDIAYIEKVQDPEFFQNAMQNLTDIIVYDIFSPPVASRVYLYPTIAAYEVMALKYPKKYNIDHFIYASSSSVYGNSNKFPLNENDNTNNPASNAGQSISA